MVIDYLKLSKNCIMIGYAYQQNYIIFTFNKINYSSTNAHPMRLVIPLLMLLAEQ